MTDKLLDQFFNNNIRALAKILTIIESRSPGLEEIMSGITITRRNSYCTGITGPPGSGKSTIVDALTHSLRGEGKTVGIVAIDPSSPFSGGAVLGDRIRMQGHAGDSGVFIRSLGSRGSHGGLSRATRDIVRAMTAFGFDQIIVETVGVGQTELDIMELADTTVVVLVPEAGDTIQTMKAGLLEIADIFVVNKSDRPGADAISQSLTTLVEMSGDDVWKIPVVATEAIRSKGIARLLEEIRNHAECAAKDDARAGRLRDIRKAELIQIITEQFEREIKEKIASDKKLARLSEKVASGSENPYAAAQEILKKLVTRT